MSELEKITATIDGDSTGFEAAMNRVQSASKDATEKASLNFKELGETLKNIGEFLDIAITIPLTELGYKAVEAFNQATHSAVVMGVELKNTGDSVGYTADQLDAMANNLNVISGIGKEDILANVTLSLLKFHDIQGKVFSDAQAAIVDFSTVTGQSLQGASQTIGRALEYPSQSLTRLQRQGVTFTNEQKDMIKSLDAAGKKGEAQAIIIDALAYSFKGAAAAMRNTPLGQIKADISAMEPALVRIGQIVETAMVPFFNVLAKIAIAFEHLSPTMQEAVVIILAIAAAIGPFLTAIGFMMKLWPTLLEGWKGLVTFGKLLVGIFTDAVLAILPWIAAIAAAIVVGQILYDNWKSIKSEGSAIWEFIAATVQSSVAWILESLEKIPGMGDKFKSTIESMRSSSAENMAGVQKNMADSMNSTVDFGTSMTNLGSEITSVTGTIGTKFKTLFSGMKQGFKDVGDSSKQGATVTTAAWIDAYNNHLKPLSETTFMAMEKAMTTFTTTTIHNLMTWTGDWKQLMASTLTSILDAIIAWGVQAMMVALNVAHAMAALFADPFLAIVVIGGLIALTAALSAPPKMAAGGIVNSPTVAMIGEAGPEVVLPLVRGSNGKMGVQNSGGSSSGNGSSSDNPGPMGSFAPSGDQHISVMLDSKEILHVVSKGSRNGNLIIHPNSVRKSAVNT